MYSIKNDNERRQIRRNTDQMFIPEDTGNVDYVAFLAWLEEGNTPEPWEPEEVAP